MAIKIKAKFYVNVRRFIGKKEVEISLAGPEEHTIREVIEKIDELEHKGFKEKIMGTEDRPGSSIRVVLNGRQIDFLQRFDTRVKNGDEISFFPLIGGG
jgi:molybdopterin synthase sulfur carrier subunit